MSRTRRRPPRRSGTRRARRSAFRRVADEREADLVITTDDRELRKACGKDCLGFTSTIGRPRDGRTACCWRTRAGRRRPPAGGVGRRARARARARAAPSRRPRVLADEPARVRHALLAVRGRALRHRRGAGLRARAAGRQGRRPPLRRPRARARTRAAGDRPRGPLGGLRHDDLHRDVRARRAHGLDQPRPGVPGRGRPARGARGGGRGDARRPQPVRAAARACRRCGRRSPTTSGASTASSWTPTPGAGDVRRHRGDRGRPARPARAGRRGGLLRALLRLLRGRDRDGRAPPPPGDAAPAGLGDRPRRAARRDHAAHPRAAAQLAAQPDGEGASRARSSSWWPPCAGSTT